MNCILLSTVADCCINLKKMHGARNLKVFVACCFEFCRLGSRHTFRNRDRKAIINGVKWKE